MVVIHLDTTYLCHVKQNETQEKLNCLTFNTYKNGNDVIYAIYLFRCVGH